MQVSLEQEKKSKHSNTAIDFDWSNLRS